MSNENPGEIKKERDGYRVGLPAVTLSRHFGSIHEKDGLYELVFERLLDHAVEKVWNAITLPEQISLWLSPNNKAVTTSIELRPGGHVRLQLMMAAIEGKITRVIENNILEYSLEGDTVLRWELFEAGKGRCRLVFTQSGTPFSHLEGTAAGWHGYLDFLALALGGKEIPQFPLELWSEISKEVNIVYHQLIKQAEK